MFNFLKKGKNQELEELLGKMQMNVSNNYKDAAQECLKALEERFHELERNGKLNGKQKVYYEEQLSLYREKMKNFTHKDQKPYWS